MGNIFYVLYLVAKNVAYDHMECYSDSLGIDI